MATISRHYFQVCTRGAERHGLPAADLLRAARIDPPALADPLWRGSTEQMAALVRRIWASLRDELMGFGTRPLKPGSLAFACELALEQDSVLRGLKRMAQFLNLASDDVQSHLTSRGGDVEIRVRVASAAPDPDHYISEFWMMAWHRLACWLAGETIPLLLAEFDYVPPAAAREEMQHMFPGERRFGAAQRRLVLDGHVRAAAIRRDARDLRAMIARAPLDLMTVPSADQSLARQVRQRLVREPALSSAELAAALDESLANLCRRLRAEGHPLSSLREAVRRDKATHWLLSGNRSVETIAEDLGYAEPRSFTRAFRHWTGQSPTQYRQRVSARRT